MQVCSKKEEIRQKEVQNVQFQGEKIKEQLRDAARA